MPKVTNRRKQDHVFGSLIQPDGGELPMRVLRSGETLEMSDAEFARYNTPSLQAMIAAGDLEIDAAAKVEQPVEPEKAAPAEEDAEVKAFVATLKKAKR